MCNSFETAEDELNFVLGNDVGRLLDIDIDPDAALANRDGEAVAAAAAAAGPPSVITHGDDKHHTSNDLNFRLDAHLLRTVSRSPDFGLHEDAFAGPINHAYSDLRARHRQAPAQFNPPANEAQTNFLPPADQLAMVNTPANDPLDNLLFLGPDFEDPPVFEDAPTNHEPFPELFGPANGAGGYELPRVHSTQLFNDGGLDFLTGGSDKLTDPPVLQDFQNCDFGLADADANALDVYEPLGNPYLTLSNDPCRPTLGLPLHASRAPPPRPFPAPAPKAPIVHSAHLFVAPKRPLPKRPWSKRPMKKRKVSHVPDQKPREEPCPVPTYVQVAEARRARQNRRHRRARDQVINLVGGGEVSEIERRAAEDASNVDPGLLADFTENYNPEAFVKTAFEHICTAMAEINEATTAAPHRPAVCSEDPPTVLGPSVSAPPGPVNGGSKGRKTPHKTRPKSAKPAAVVTPPSSNKKTDDPGAPHLKTLPSGKDPASRRLRQLMRNRLSAQASRDRRRRAIEDAQRVLEKKEGEVRALKKTVSEETRRAAMLEKAIGYARTYLGPEKYSKVAGLNVSRVACRGTNVIESN